MASTSIYIVSLLSRILRTLRELGLQTMIAMSLLMTSHLAMANEDDDDIDGIMAILEAEGSSGVIKGEGDEAGYSVPDITTGSSGGDSPMVDAEMDALRGEISSLAAGLTTDAFAGAEKALAEAGVETRDGETGDEGATGERLAQDDAVETASAADDGDSASTPDIRSQAEALELPDLPKADLSVAPWLSENNGWALRLFFEDLTELAHIKDLEVPIMREEYLERIYSYLSTNNKPYTIVYGQNGVGKSLVPNAIAVEIKNETAPFPLHGKRVLKVDFEALLQEYHPDGERPEVFQKQIGKPNVANRIAAIRKDLEEFQNDVILVVDDNDPGEKSRKEIIRALANMLDRFPNVPFLLIGLNADELKPNPTFDSVPRVEFTQLSPEQNLEIVMHTVEGYAAEKMVTLSPDTVRELMKVMKAKVGDKNFPDSVIKTVYGAIDEISQARITGVSRHIRETELEIAELDRKIKALSNEFGEDGQTPGPFTLLQLGELNQDREDLVEKNRVVSEATQALEKAFQFLQGAEGILQNLKREKLSEENKRQGLRSNLIKYKAQVDHLTKLVKALEMHGQNQEALEKERAALDELRGKLAQTEQQIEFSDSKIAKKTEQIDAVRAKMQGVYDQMDAMDIPSELSKDVDLDVMLYILSKKNGLSMSNLYSYFSTPEETIERLIKTFENNYVGQEHFVNAIVQFERDGRASAKGPMYSALLAGGSTKGKTELSKVLGKHVNPDCFFSYDMGNYLGSDGVNSFLGSSIGYTGDDGMIYADTNNCAEGVLNFDEMDKTDPDIIKSFFYPLLREGIIRTKKGKIIDLRNFRIVMSTNALEDLLALVDEAEPRIKQYIVDTLIKTEVNGQVTLNPEAETQMNRDMLETEARVPGRPSYPEAFLRRPTYIGLAADFTPEHYRALVNVIFNADHGRTLIESHRIKVRLMPDAVQRLAMLATNKSRDAANVGNVLRSYVIRFVKNAYNSGKIFRNDIINFDFDGTNFNLTRVDAEFKSMTGNIAAQERSESVPEHVYKYYQPGYRCEAAFAWGL